MDQEMNHSVLFAPPLHPTRQETQQSKITISQITALEATQHEQIEKMKMVLQQHSSACLTKEAISELQTLQLHLTHQIETEMKELFQINRNVILEPKELNDSKILSQKLMIQQQKIELYRKELQQLLNTHQPPQT